jgi:hypothetical protein
MNVRVSPVFSVDRKVLPRYEFRLLGLGGCAVYYDVPDLRPSAD